MIIFMGVAPLGTHRSGFLWNQTGGSASTGCWFFIQSSYNHIKSRTIKSDYIYTKSHYAIWQAL